ncbi:MAG: DUF4382 domain-containing protein [Pseudomonadales bacterium]|nr:DUF4382 domain-containing protein [Pseudomonadales bacterium]
MFFQSVSVNRDEDARSSGWARWLISMNVAVALMASAGCGGGGSSSSADGSASDASVTEQGELALAITDAEGDFVSYTVDVDSITLEKANGAVVETVPLNTRIDFAQYTDLTEFFTIRTLPAGNYTKVNLNLDFSDSEIVVQDESGETHQATAVDGEGNVLADYTVNVTLAEDQVVKIRRGVPAALTIDFDLDSSNTIVSYDPATVEVEPFILTSASLDTEREHRGRGLLQSVDVDNSSFTMKLKPFHHRSGEFGGVNINVSDSTHYEIDGSQYEGAAGLVAMTDLVTDTPLIVFGQMSEGLTFNAVYVLGGSSVPWVGRDTARGVVIARDGNVLTLRGSHVERTDGSVTFYDNIQVTLGENTQVTRQALSNEGLDASDVSVGQRLVVFGELSGDQIGEYSIDASQGHVRLLMNLIKGEVTSVSPLVVDLRWINGRRLGLFDFAGTGLTEDNDANPDHYEIDVASLTLDNLELGSLVKVRGYPAAYGEAPEDFAAQTVIDINTEQRAGAMNVLWLDGGSSAPFIATNAESLVLDVSNANYQVKMAGVPLDFFDGLQNDPVVSSFGFNDKGVYAIKLSGEPGIQLFNQFSNYVEALNQYLSNGNKLRRMVALGRYDQTQDEMNSVVVTSRFKP